MDTREAFTYSPQDGENGHCFSAQVWDAKGNNVAVVDGKSAQEATARAKFIAEAFNATLTQPQPTGDAEMVNVCYTDGSPSREWATVAKQAQPSAPAGALTEDEISQLIEKAGWDYAQQYAAVISTNNCAKKHQIAMGYTIRRVLTAAASTDTAKGEE